MDRHKIPSVEGIPDLIGRLDRLVEQRPAGDPLLPTLLLHGQGADRLVHGFAQRLDTYAFEAVVPHILVTSGDHRRQEPGDAGGESHEAADSRADILLLDEIARGFERAMPSPMGKLELPTYWTVREMLDVVIIGNSYRAQRKQLRDALYLRHQDRSATARWIAHLVDSAATHRVARFWQALLQPLLVGLPRAVFGWRLGRGRRLRWLSEQIARATGRSGRDVLGSAICLTRDGIERTNTALVRRVLLLSLLHDLDLATRTSLVSPSRRRRVTPFVLLLTSVAPGNAAYRLLDTFGAVHREIERGSTLILASVAPTGSAPPSLMQAGDSPHPASPLSLREAAEAMESVLRPGRREVGGALAALPVAVPLEPHDEQAESWLAVNQKVRPEEGRLPWTVPLVTGMVCAAGVLLVAVLGWRLVRAAGGDSGACPSIHPAGGSSELIGLGDGTAGCSFFPDPENGIEEDYRSVELAIAEENQRVLAAGEHGLPYRTMVFFAPLTLPDQPERVGQSSLRQLRGIALAQAEANRQAETDENKVRARVLLANPGDRFAHGLEVADQINRRVEEDDDSIVGVLGIAQSRQISREAIAVLAEKNLPVVAGPVTGDAMITSSPYYYQVSPLNQRVAQMLVDVATNQPVIGPEDSGGELRTADRAVIVTDHSDEYSQNLADDLVEELTTAGHTVTRTFSYPAEDRSEPLPRTRDREVRVPSLDQLAQDVCTSIDSSRDVVFFTSRAQQLAGMLNSMRGNPNCEGTITVLAGTDITKFVQNPDVDLGRFPFLRLYYGAFASRELVDGELSTTAQGFVHDYEQAYGSEDLLVDMSDPALTYDALSTMQEAINLAFQGRLSLTPDVVAAKLADEEVELDGATGYITLGGALEGDRVPKNKPVLVVQAAPSPTELLLSCGRFAKSIDHDTWGPGDEHSCPQDE